jgi:hypothetical protein
VAFCLHRNASAKKKIATGKNNRQDIAGFFTKFQWPVLLKPVHKKAPAKAAAPTKSKTFFRCCVCPKRSFGNYNFPKRDTAVSFPTEEPAVSCRVVFQAESLCWQRHWGEVKNECSRKNLLFAFSYYCITGCCQFGPFLLRFQSPGAAPEFFCCQFDALLKVGNTCCCYSDYTPG